MRPFRQFVLPLAAVVTLAGCGSGTSSSSQSSVKPSPTATATAAAAGFPVTVDNPGGEVTVPTQPQRIVSLSPSSTEVLFAIGAGDQVVAVDSLSNYPTNAPVTDLSGFEPNAEAVLKHKPDLVVVSNDTNNIVASLTKAGVPVIVSEAPTTIDDGYAGMADLGRATGHIDETAKVVSTMRAEIAKTINDAPKTPVRVYHELDKTYYAASSHSFIGSVYKSLGATNIADAADTAKGGYPQMTQEAIIKANPQLIVITDQVSYSAIDVLKRPGWNSIDAVKNRHVVSVNADVSSRWGPRLPQLVKTLAHSLESVKAPA